MSSADGTVRIEKLVTSGTFSLDGGTWDVDNNVWLIGDDDEVLVIDAAHDADAIKAAIGSPTGRRILCTHGHNDHIDAAPAAGRSDRRADLVASRRCRRCGAWPTRTGNPMRNCTPGRC